MILGVLGQRIVTEIEIAIGVIHQGREDERADGQ